MQRASRRGRHLGIVVVALALLGTWGPVSGQEPAEPSPASAPKRNVRWAVALERPGLPNLHRVSPTLYRGAQPTAEGFRELQKLGVKTVVNLRAFHSDRDELRGLDLGYEHVSFKAWHAEDEDLARFLALVTDAARQPVFVHCQHGADRTGLSVAIYRVAVEGWTKDDAIEEMTSGEFGFHAVWQNLIEYLRDLDVERLRIRAGLPAPAASRRE